MATLALSPIGHELLDDPGADPAIVTESFRNLARSNWWFGGAAAVHFGLAQLIPRSARRHVAHAARCRHRGRRPAAPGRALGRRGAACGSTGIGLERSRVAAALARRGGLPSVVGCAGALPVPRAERGHRHDEPADPSPVARRRGRGHPRGRPHRARRRRARRPAAQLPSRRSASASASGLLGFDPATRADGVTSVRRGYLPHELSAMLRDAGVSATVHRRPGFRLVAAWRTS